MTQTATTNRSVTTDLAPGAQLVLTAAENSSAFVERLYQRQVLDTAVVTSSHTFGPYLAPMTLRISCTSGEASFTVSDATSVVPAGAIGRHAIPVMAGAIRPSVSGGCAALASIASAANQPDLNTLDFDASTPEYAQFAIPMPPSWDEGTITFAPIWSHAATDTSFGVAWSLQAVAVGDGDAIGAAFGSAVLSVDTGGTTDDLYQGPESAAITVAGTPAAGDVVFFRLSRVTGDAGDTMAIDARLHGVVIYITTDAETDA